MGAKTVSMSYRTPNSVEGHARSLGQNIYYYIDTKVCPFNNRTEDDDQLIREHLTKHAVFINNFAKVAFLILLVTFNVLFWTTAYMQHYSPAEDYL